MKVLFLAAEASPIAKVGGLGDVAGELPTFLRDLGVDLLQGLPFYPFLRRAQLSVERVGELTVETHVGPIRAEVFLTVLGKVPLLLVESELTMAKDSIYGDPREDALAFGHFSVACLLACDRLGWAPEVVHAHDWHTAPAVAWAAKNRPAVTTIQTIHNLAYMGQGGEPAMEQLGLLPDPGYGLPRWSERLPLPIGLASAEWITTVSPSYAEEIQGPEFGCGLEDFLKSRGGRLSGILNGIDPERWNPATDRALTTRFSFDSIQPRRENKANLQGELGLPPDTSVPLLAMVSRLDKQKGVDIAMDALQSLSGRRWQFILLGKGDAEVEQAAARFAGGFADRARFLPIFDPELARRIYGGSDMMLIPSRYEPCGLVQMIGMRYGAVPVARAVGGLRDTIVDAADPLEGNGFLSAETHAGAFAATLSRALEAFEDAGAWAELRRRGMRRDFTWKRAAGQYTELYRRAILEHRT
jgi:starch synthase